MSKLMTCAATLLTIAVLLTPESYGQSAFGHASVGLVFTKDRVGKNPGIIASIGGERRFGSSDLNLGGEVGVFTFGQSDTGLLTMVNMAYHPKEQSQRWDPFLVGGGAAAFNFGGGGAAGLAYGGGMNRWGGGFGARVEFRHLPFRLGTDGFDCFILRLGMLFR